MATGMGIDAGTTSKEPAIMELAGKVLDMATTLDDQMAEFLEGGKPSDCAEKSPQPVLSALNAITVRLEETARKIDNATNQFHRITNKIA